MPMMMWGDAWRARRKERLAFLASLGVHAIIVAILISELPKNLPQPEEPISVELVREPPKPPAPAKPPAPPKPPEPPATPEPPKAASEAPLPVIQPAVQFGEKDGGPKTSLDGRSATEVQPSPQSPREPDDKDRPQPPRLTVAKATGNAPPQGEGEAPAPPLPDPARAQRPPQLHKAKTLFSRKTDAGPLATTAMRSIPREVRIARLCLTELKAQLIYGTPAYFPEIMPFDRLKEGTVLEHDNAAFFASAKWYDLSYRCEVDAEGTKIVNFAYEVGQPLTREEWARRGLPEN
jgi:hypothetical protein